MLTSNSDSDVEAMQQNIVIEPLSSRWTVGVYGLVFDEKGNVLLVHRRDRDIWQSPGGGVEVNETPTEAVVREVEEESGFLVAVHHVTGVYFAVARRDIILSFFCTIVSGQARTNSEADDVCFFDPHSLPDVTPATRKRIHDYLTDPNSLSWSEDME